ncbi:hypothetical protein [Roseomonas elaeocarpi]
MLLLAACAAPAPRLPDTVPPAPAVGDQPGAPAASGGSRAELETAPVPGVELAGRPVMGPDRLASPDYCRRMASIADQQRPWFSGRNPRDTETRDDWLAHQATQGC